MLGTCREFASSFAALSDVKDKLDRDSQALSEAEAAVSADKHSMEQQAATARHQVQRMMARQVSCISGGALLLLQLLCQPM